MSIPIFIPEDIVSKGFLKLVDVVGELKEIEEKDNLFADIPIGATIQDSGKRKRSDDSHHDPSPHYHQPPSSPQYLTIKIEATSTTMTRIPISKAFNSFSKLQERNST